jgi:PD-(D/E)XK endonuclease
MEHETGDPTAASGRRQGPGKLKPLSEPQRNFQHRRNAKRTGELSEAAFLLKATSMGLVVTKPWGDSERYDFIVDSGELRSRVQIKCTASMVRGGWEVPSSFRFHRRMYRYTAAEIDVLAAHIVPLDVWYIVPIEVCYSTFLRLVPANREHARLEIYREAWHLLGCEKQDCRKTVQPAAASSPAEEDLA